MRGKLRLAGRVLAIGAFALLMTGCLKVDMDLKVSSDNTVSGKVIFAVDKQLLAMSGSTFDEAMSGSTPFPSGSGVSESDYEDDTFTGKQYEFDGLPLEKFNTPNDTEALNIVREGDTFTVHGVLDFSSSDTGTGTSDTAVQMMQSAEIRVAITFPGAVTSSNGQVDGNTVTWTPKIGERTELTAVASAVESGGGNTTMIIIIAAVALLVVIVLVVVMSKRGKGGEPAMAAADAGLAAGVPEVGMPEAPSAPPAGGVVQPPPPPPPVEPPPG